MANGNVAVACGTGAAVSTTTSASGAWNVSLNQPAFPCTVDVSGASLPSGRHLRGYATSATNVNVTPLTSLIGAFAKHAANGSTPSQAQLSAAAEKVNDLLRAGGYTNVPADALTKAFQPVAGDPHDAFLEDLMRSLADVDIDFDQMLQDVATEGATATPIPHTHVFKTNELAAIPQLNKATIGIEDGALAMSLQAGGNAVGSYVGGGNGNKAVLQVRASMARSYATSRT